jgi:hypothetical protein
VSAAESKANMSKIAMASISLSMAAVLYSEMLQADAGERAMNSAAGE